jgi:hypothetical protein
VGERVDRQRPAGDGVPPTRTGGVVLTWPIGHVPSGRNRQSHLRH